MRSNRMSIRWMTALLTLVALLSLTAGCGSQDQGITVKYDPEQSKKQDEKSVEAIKNNPNSPQAQKDAIMARMKGRGAVR